MLPKFLLSASTFRKICKPPFLYVDKTKYAYELIVNGEQYFLSRPRRFGKSLFISTLKEILQGNKELFDNVWIAGSDYHWDVHGVIDLDFSKLDINSPETFREIYAML